MGVGVGVRGWGGQLMVRGWRKKPRRGGVSEKWKQGVWMFEEANHGIGRMAVVCVCVCVCVCVVVWKLGEWVVG